MTPMIFNLGPTELIILFVLLLLCAAVVIGVVLVVVLVVRSAGRRNSRHAMATRAGASSTDELATLASMHQQGLLTDDEFAEAKRRLLN